MVENNKKDIIEKLTFGQRVAEDEPSLEDYFVETPLWKKILRGEVDIVYGSKGSGKSAIFHLLTSAKCTPDNVFIIPAENPRGTSIFSGIKSDPPTSEAEFVYLWKLYILSLIVSQSEIIKKFKDSNLSLYKKLNSVGVIDKDKNNILKNALKYISKVSVLSNTLEVSLNALPVDEKTRVDVDLALGALNAVLLASEKVAWVAFDRLDSVFDTDLVLEENALRALFKAYLDILRHREIQLKIFLRTDIWNRLTKKGFREASHITRSDYIEWSENNIVNLISRRLVNNTVELFYRVYPRRIDSGSKKPESIKWMTSRVSDGSKKVAPRELIHLLNQTKDEQVKSLEIGESLPEGENLFTSISVKKRFPQFPKTRLEQTLYAEYPDVKKYISLLEGEKAQQTIRSLSSLWEIKSDQAMLIATELTEIGFFEVRGNKNNPEYWIPFLYRPVLKLIQGRAEENLSQSQ